MAGAEPAGVRYTCPYEYCGKEETRLERIESHIAAVHLHYWPYACGRPGCGARKPTAGALCDHYALAHGGEPVEVAAAFSGDELKQHELYRAIDRCLATVQDNFTQSHQRAVSPPVLTPDQGSDAGAPLVPQPVVAEPSTAVVAAPVGRRTMSKISAKSRMADCGGAQQQSTGDIAACSTLDTALSRLYQMAHNLPPESLDQPADPGPSLAQPDPAAASSFGAASAITDDNFKFHCSKCGKRFVESRSFWSHWKRHRQMAKRSEDRPFKCDMCPPPGQWFATDRALACHQHVTHRKRFERQCDVCKKVFVSRAAYNTHVKEQHGFVPYECEKCGKRFHNSGSLRSHEVQHELSSVRSADRTHACGLCNEFFKTNRGLSNHIVRAHGCKYEQQCPHCDKVYVSRASFSAHLSAAHNIAQYVCAKCGKDNRSERELRTHQQRWCPGAVKAEPAAEAGDERAAEESADSDDVPLAKVAGAVVLDKESDDNDTEESLDEHRLNRSTSGGMQLRKVVAQTKRLAHSFDEADRRTGQKAKRSPASSAKEAAASKVDECTHVCTQCKTQVSAASVCEHVLRAHIRRPLVRCPVPNCLFADQFDVAVVLLHLKATHAKPYCDMQPVDDRGECQADYGHMVAELFPYYTPRPFQSELGLDAVSSPPPTPGRWAKREAAATADAPPEHQQHCADGGGVCMPCGKWVASRAQTTHVYMEMFKYDASLGRFKCTRCTRRSSGRGALVSHFAVSHRQVPTGESIRDCADELIHAFQHWWKRCFGAPPPM